MSRLRRAFSHPDRANDPHARARSLISDRFLAPLDPADEGWLIAHLDDCVRCRETSASWSVDRDALRALAAAIVPPRDLGARLASALDGEERGERRSAVSLGRPVRRPAHGRPSRVRAMTIALVAALAIVALLVLPIVAPLGVGPGAPGKPAATPIIVAGAAVAWARTDETGRYVLDTATVDRVCPGTDTAACSTLDAAARTLVTLDIRPSQVILPPSGDRAVAVGPTGIYTFVIPEQGTRVTPRPGLPSESPTLALPTPAATEVPASPPAGTPAPSDLVSPEPTGQPSPTAKPSPPVLVSAAPGSPAAETPPVPSAETVPPGTPAPVAASALAILENVFLVGAAPAYSPDGQWLAFSARPASGDRGPDLYAWRVGDERARRLTNDGASVFSGWLGERILASSVELIRSVPATPRTEEPRQPDATAQPRATGTGSAAPSKSGDPGEASPAAETTAEPSPVQPSPSVAPSATIEPSPAVPVTPGPTSTAESATDTPVPNSSPAASQSPAGSAAPTTEPSVPPEPRAVAVSFLLDPVSDTVESLARSGLWRPVVDPSGTTVIFFTGRFAWSEEEQTWVPSSGRLVVAAWADAIDPEHPLDSSALPGDPGRTGKTLEWNVRWADDGGHIAVWVGDEGTTTTGRLSLYATDKDGRPTDALLDETAALPAFSINNDRLVWATPTGQDGEGSMVGVFAWGGSAPGAAFSAPQPGPGVVVVR